MCSEYKKKILFVGIPDMALVCLEGLVKKGFNIVGVLGPKKNHETYDMFKNFALGFGLNFIEYDELDDKGLIKKINGLNPDIAIVCSFNYKVPKPLLNSVRCGFINVHPSLLPMYRGANPYSAVIFNGEKETGLTLHFMDETFDTGDIVMQKSIQISSYETMGTLFNRFNILALDMLCETLQIFEKENTIPRTKQPEGDYLKAPALSEGELLINYNNTAEAIDKQIRGLNPFVIARTFFRQTLVKIFSAEYSCENIGEGENGQIIRIEDDKFYIKTGNGVLCPTTLQFGSFFTGSAKDFIRILNLQIGERFGG